MFIYYVQEYIKGAQLADNMDGRTKYSIEVATRLIMIMSN